jgi:hypothetical protein
MGGAVPPLPNTPSWRSAQLGGAHTKELAQDRVQERIFVIAVMEEIS